MITVSYNPAYAGYPAKCSLANHKSHQSVDELASRVAFS